jgi:hypothetical protein
MFNALKVLLNISQYCKAQAWRLHATRSSARAQPVIAGR